jgi:23S rRNA pseudouridine2605 synthase
MKMIPSMQQRLQKIIAATGIASRRAAEQMILRGEVTVNGQVVTKLGAKADPERDHIKVRGKLINPILARHKKIYFLVNKPRGYLCSAFDPKGRRPLVTELIPASKRRGIFPAGQLDLNAEGLVILTNDGGLAELLARSEAVPETYLVKVRGSPSQAQIERLKRGLAGTAEIKLLKRTREAENAWYELTARECRSQKIRRAFDLIGHPVMKLRRIRIGQLVGGGLAAGACRELSAEDINRLFDLSRGACDLNLS